MANESWENRFDNNRRMSLLNLSNHSEEHLRPRSNSTGNIRTSLRTPTPYPFHSKCFVYPSPSFASRNDFDSPVMVVTGKSPSILDCTKMIKLRSSTAYKFRPILVVILTLIGVLVAGIVFSKVGSKSKVSCVGKHFCYPTTVPVPKLFNLKVLDSNKSSTKQIQDAVQKAINKREHDKSNDRILKPRIIPKIVGTIEVKKTENVKSEGMQTSFPSKKMQSASQTSFVNSETKMDQHSSVIPEVSQRLDYKYDVERDTNKYGFERDTRDAWHPNSVNREFSPKKERSRFMAQNSQNSHYERQYMPSNSERERHIQMEMQREFARNSRPHFHPPGVNPRVYERAYEL